MVKLNRMLVSGFLSLACWSGSWAQDHAAQTFKRADGTAIHHQLTRSTTEGFARELLVILQGSDCNSAAHIPAIKPMAQALPHADLLTVEKYGITPELPYSDEDERPDCPTAYLRHDSPMQRVRDVAQVISALRLAHGYQRVVAIGGSEGALIANALAAQPGVVDVAVSFNGGGQWFIDDLLHGVQAAPGSPAEKTRNERALRTFSQALSTRGNHLPPDTVISDHGLQWWRESLAIDQQALLARSRQPLLLIQSGQDESVSPASVLKMVGQLHQAGQRNISYRTYPDLDHRLREADGSDALQRVVRDIAAWLADHRGMHAPRPRKDLAAYAADPALRGDWTHPRRNAQC